jgi:hypothetical protein
MPIEQGWPMGLKLSRTEFINPTGESKIGASGESKGYSELFGFEVRIYV